MDAPATPRPSRRASDLPGSPIRRIFNAAQALQQEGRTVYRLDIGDPDFPLPQRAVEGIVAALHSGHTHYSSMFGIAPLRQAIARHLIRRWKVECEASHIVLNPGATAGLHSAFQLACDSGDSLLLPEIYWPNYIQQATLSGIRVNFYALDEHFHPVPGSFESCRDPRLRGLLINSPSNPTGGVIPEPTLRALYRFCREREIWLISDEAYVDYVFQGDTLSPLLLDRRLPEEERRVLSIFSFSKSFAATGLRMGWTVFPNAALANLAGRMNEPLTGSLSTPVQWGMVEALSVDDTAERREALRGRWKLAGELLREGGLPVHPPEGGLFYFLDVSGTSMTGDEFADRLLAHERVAVVPGSGFGLVPEPEVKEGFRFSANSRAIRSVRLCFAVPEPELRAGLMRLAAFYSRHRKKD